MAKKQNQKKDIISYYDQTEFDYKVAWYGKDNPALHFGFYDKEEADSHYDALSHTNKILAANALVKDGDKVLDAGCGLGGSTIWLARHFDVEAVGISLPARQIVSCKERAASMELKGKTDFVQADYTNTPFEDESFDVVWACESLCHAKNKVDFYKEAYRILKPGGRIVVAEYLRTERPLGEKDEILLKNKWLNNWAIDDIDTEKEHHGHLKSCGFQEINIQNFNDKVGTSLRNLHEKCTRSYPIERVLKFFGIRSAVQHGNLVGSIHQYTAFKKGIWWYSVISAKK
ncbi:MAG: tocopherol O-methyltransferase [Maribacter sp.]|jgi:tocopherol O-methyltransferase